jgi:hypothetical protein
MMKLGLTILALVAFSATSAFARFEYTPYVDKFTDAKKRTISAETKTGQLIVISNGDAGPLTVENMRVAIVLRAYVCGDLDDAVEVQLLGVKQDGLKTDVVKSAWQVPDSKESIVISGRFQPEPTSAFADNLANEEEIRLRVHDECGEVIDIRLSTSGWKDAVAAFNADY